MGLRTLRQQDRWDGNRLACARDFGSLVHVMAGLACARDAPSFMIFIIISIPEKESGENEFSFREICFMNGFDEYVDEDNIDEVLNKAVEEMKTDIRRPR